MFLDMQWDIALHSMDPRLVKLLKPGAIGLTSRRQDRETGEITTQGNMKLNGAQKQALRVLEEAQAAARAETTRQVITATVKAGYKLKRTRKGMKASDV
jgi:hypothetical protein